MLSSATSVMSFGIWTDCNSRPTKMVLIIVSSYLHFTEDEYTLCRGHAAFKENVLQETEVETKANEEVAPKLASCLQ